MAKNCLEINDSKTEIVLFGPSSSIQGIANHLGPLTPNLHTQARNLGVIFHSVLKFDKQINTVVKVCFLQLRNIAKQTEPLVYWPKDSHKRFNVLSYLHTCYLCMFLGFLHYFSYILLLPCYVILLILLYNTLIDLKNALEINLIWFESSQSELPMLDNHGQKCTSGHLEKYLCCDGWCFTGLSIREQSVSAVIVPSLLCRSPPGLFPSSSSSSSSSVVVLVTGDRRRRCRRQGGCYWSPVPPTTGEIALLLDPTESLSVL